MSDSPLSGKHEIARLKRCINELHAQEKQMWTMYGQLRAELWVTELYLGTEKRKDFKAQKAKLLAFGMAKR